MEVEKGSHQTDCQVILMSYAPCPHSNTRHCDTQVSFEGSHSRERGPAEGRAFREQAGPDSEAVRAHSSGQAGPETTANAIALIRLAVGGVFLVEGILKFLYPNELAAGRFAKIGIPDPQVMGPLVGGAEVICGALVLAGLFTRLAAIPLLIDITVARLQCEHQL
jgi:uncharacterized protein YjeT (DUF2065 family)